MNGGAVSFTILVIAGNDLAKISAISAKAILPDIKKNAFTFAFIKAFLSIVLLRIILSFVKTIQPLAPTDVSHTESSASGGK